MTLNRTLVSLTILNLKWKLLTFFLRENVFPFVSLLQILAIAINDANRFSKKKNCLYSPRLLFYSIDSIHSHPTPSLRLTMVFGCDCCFSESQFCINPLCWFFQRLLLWFITHGCLCFVLLFFIFVWLSVGRCGIWLMNVACVDYSIHFCILTRLTIIRLPSINPGNLLWKSAGFKVFLWLAHQRRRTNKQTSGEAKTINRRNDGDEDQDDAAINQPKHNKNDN